MNQDQFKLCVASISPIDRNGELDVLKLVEYCQYMTTDGGCDSVAPLGTTGEGTSLSFANRKAVPKAFHRANIDPDRVILGVGCPAISETVELILHAQMFGYNRVLVLPPYYYKNISPEGLYSYFAKLVEAIGNSDVRIYLYHFPQMSMVPFPANVVGRLFREFNPVICGLKDSSGDFTQTRSFVEDTGGINAGFEVYPSTESVLLEAQKIGCAGIISGSVNAFAGCSRAVLRSPADQSRLMEMVISARQLAEQYPLIPMMKVFQAIRSGDPSWETVLPPLTALSGEMRSALLRNLVELGLYPD